MSIFSVFSRKISNNTNEEETALEHEKNVENDSTENGLRAVTNVQDYVAQQLHDLEMGLYIENEERDIYFADAGRFIIEKDKASIGMLQRWFKIGFNRAARIMDQLSDAGVVGPEEGTKPRKVLMSMEELDSYLSGGEG